MMKWNMILVISEKTVANFFLRLLYLKSLLMIQKLNISLTMSLNPMN